VSVLSNQVILSCSRRSSPDLPKDNAALPTIACFIILNSWRACHNIAAGTGAITPRKRDVDSPLICDAMRHLEDYIINFCQ
jgi:hypothetical protein